MICETCRLPCGVLVQAIAHGRVISWCGTCSSLGASRPKGGQRSAKSPAISGEWDAPAVALRTGQYDGGHAAIREVDGEVCLFGGPAGIVQSMVAGRGALATLGTYLDGAST